MGECIAELEKSKKEAVKELRSKNRDMKQRVEVLEAKVAKDKDAVDEVQELLGCHLDLKAELKKRDDEC
jgi:chaperonin cofactor prefoldin